MCAATVTLLTGVEAGEAPLGLTARIAYDHVPAITWESRISVALIPAVPTTEALASLKVCAGGAEQLEAGLVARGVREGEGDVGVGVVGDRQGRRPLQAARLGRVHVRLEHALGDDFAGEGGGVVPPQVHARAAAALVLEQHEVVALALGDC